MELEKHNRRRWTQDEINQLRSLVNKFGNVELAEQFNTTKFAIRNVMIRNEIRRSPEFTKELKRRTAVELNKKSGVGPKNFNWRGGISQDNYRYKKIQQERYPDRVNARRLVYNEIRSGRLIKQPCEICGDLKVQAHHDDYAKPLEVRWLCKKHHRYTVHDGKN
jgi:hypothetical protein